jgi:hypothetical protein
MDLTIWIMPIRVDVDFLCMDLTAQSSPNGLIGRERERERERAVQVIFCKGKGIVRH